MKNTLKYCSMAIALLIMWGSCQQNNKQEADQSIDGEVVIADSDLSKGFQLLESTCFSCHSPDAEVKNKVAPTMADIKNHYLAEGATKESFTGSLIKFVNDPSEKNATIPQAVEQYGLMPKFDLSDEQITHIANYIYYTDLEAPDWYASHFEKEKQKHKIDLADLSYIELGKRYAMSTKSELGKNLKGAIKSKGTDYALEFCNEKAYTLTDSMSVELNAKIKRVSDKPRNPHNKANHNELKFIDAGKLALAVGEKIKPELEEIEGKMVGYYPIVTNKMCLQCHGEPGTQIRTTTLEKLNSLYPEDMAKGYAENQLRGIWVVEMDKR